MTNETIIVDTTKKKDLLSPYFRIWAQSYNPKQPYQQIQSDFSLTKTKFEKIHRTTKESHRHWQRGFKISETNRVLYK